MMAEGLNRMFHAMEVECKVFYQGHAVHPRLETLRKAFPRTPIVNYDLFFLATRGPWARHLREGRNPYVNIGGNFGLERYDWYLCASVVSEFPLPEGDWPFNLIGVNLDDGTLYPEEKHEFMALVDFERPDHMRERAIQIQALEETQTKYVVLHGHSTQSTRSVEFTEVPASTLSRRARVSACPSVNCKHAEPMSSRHMLTGVHHIGSRMTFVSRDPGICRPTSWYMAMTRRLSFAKFAGFAGNTMLVEFFRLSSRITHSCSMVTSPN